MAYVKMHQIKRTVGQAVRYIVRPDATEGGLYVSTNCAVLDNTDHLAIEQQFLATHDEQQHLGRKGDVLAHHVIQSFKPGEISDPNVAHRIGVEFAEKITKGRHEYVVATHLDKGHVHNHIIVNAVSFETHRKLRVQKGTLNEFRKISNELSIENGLSVIMSGESRAWGPGAVQAQARGGSQLDLVKLAIDRAVGQSRTWAELESALAAEGVKVGRSSKRHITYQGFGMQHAARDVKFGPGYQEADIMARLGRDAVMRFDCHQSLVSKIEGDSVTLRLPGTSGSRFVAVRAEQIVRHGTTLRVYLPSVGTSAVLNRSGSTTARVPNHALYAVFQPPARQIKRWPDAQEAGKVLSRAKSRRARLERMHTQEQVLNVRAKYSITSSDQAVRQAVELEGQLDRLSSRIQVLAVAMDEAPAGSERRADFAVKLSAAQRDMSDLDSNIGALLTWAKRVDQQAERAFRQATVQERLRGLEARDVLAVNPLGKPPAPERPEPKPARDAPDMSTMTLKERMAWLRQRDREREQKPQQRDQREGRKR